MTGVAAIDGPVARAPRRRSRGLPGRAGRAVLIVAVAVVFLFPLFWVVITSLASSDSVYTPTPNFIPQWNWDNYVRAWQGAPWLRYFGNTVFIAGTVAALCVTTSLLAGFAFALMRFRGRGVAFALTISVLMVPEAVLLIPNFLVASRAGLLDTYLIQIIPWAATGFGVFLVRQFFQTLPPEIFEAAEIDGAGPLRMLFQVGAPLAVPSLVLVGLNAFLGSWNSFLWPYLFTSSDAMRPIQVGLQQFFGAEGTDWTGLSAAVVFTTIPLVVLFLFLQRFFISDAFAGAVRG
ncbi:carbohydrate ABC transporter permease [Microbacterium indicum]|uniref:carbohydrate ABC transporter permease n=1 Tax=Microbacterium indicum TaxID=358100 RepID=UPI000401F648|nr:carbohydrate ABC transporter permease [Microbacterium indicum]